MITILIFLTTSITVNAGRVITNIKFKEIDSMKIETAKFDATLGRHGQIIKIDTENKLIMNNKLKEINDALQGYKLNNKKNKEHLNELISKELKNLI